MKAMRNNRITTLLLAAAVMMTGAGTGAFAAGQSVTLNLGNYTFEAGDVGNLQNRFLTDWAEGGTDTNICTTDGQYQKPIQARFKRADNAGTIADPVTGKTHTIQKTNIDGIGLIAFTDAAYGAGNRSSRTNSPVGSAWTDISSVQNGAEAKEGSLTRWGYRLVTIPGKAKLGTYSLNRDFSEVAVACNGSQGTDTGTVQLSGKVTVRAPTCTFPHIWGSTDVRMKEVDWEEANKTGINGTFAPRDETWIINCDSEALPKVTFTDKNKPGNRSNVITLTNPTASTTAKGIGYQVGLQGGYFAYEMGKSVNVAGSPNPQGNHVMPLTFRYIKTASEITPGAANAILDMTVTYQ
ncbi:fimbrial protein [Morganella psychrotolerans]|uniref:fimbrial protein n=1 Tax=Morganella psychrotolerans TaxID=368603 RepID=UPI0039AEF21A